jgi:hypothetical protein
MDEELNIKKIIIVEKPSTTTSIKKIQKKEKQVKTRVEAQTWELSDAELSHPMQLDCLNKEHTNANKYTNKKEDQEATNANNANKKEDQEANNTNNTTKVKYHSRLLTHIKSKLSGYKQQDIVKNKWDRNKFVKLDEVVGLLIQCDLKCVYCSQETYILYNHVREGKQWTLDRIQNSLGHNSGNLVIACLECNLKRRRINKDSFMFSKNMVIIKT